MCVGLLLRYDNGLVEHRLCGSWDDTREDIVIGGSTWLRKK